MAKFNGLLYRSDGVVLMYWSSLRQWMDSLSNLKTAELDDTEFWSPISRKEALKLFPKAFK